MTVATESKAITMFDAVQAEATYRQQQVAKDWGRTPSRWFRRRPAAVRVAARHSAVRAPRTGVSPAAGA